MKEDEPYALGYSVSRDRWFINMRGTDQKVADNLRSRASAVNRLDALTEAWIAARGQARVNRKKTGEA